MIRLGNSFYLVHTANDSVIGQSVLPEACPVCAHEPLDAALCKPNKALRTTLKAFLRTEEKKREKERRAATPAPAPSAPPSEPTSTPTPVPAPAQPGEQAEAPAQSLNVAEVSEPTAAPEHTNVPAEQSVVSESTEDGKEQANVEAEQHPLEALEGQEAPEGQKGEGEQAPEGQAVQETVEVGARNLYFRTLLIAYSRHPSSPWGHRPRKRLRQWQLQVPKRSSRLSIPRRTLPVWRRPRRRLVRCGRRLALTR